MEKKNVLVLGSGGREHALGWKLSQSQYIDKVYYCPGNGGTQNNISYSITDFSKIRSFALENNCMVVVGPEDPLTKGIVNELSDDIPIFGPTKEAARLESSKAFAKNFMKQNDITTANFSIFTDSEKAKDFVSNTNKKLVIKADGLAAGKGVIVCDSKEDALNAIDLIMVKKTFGDSGNVIVIEERIFGEEVSFIGIADGETIIPMATSQDHKRIYDNDQGPNTGGMGSFSPSPIVSDDLSEYIMNKIMKKTIHSMKNDDDNKNKFKGFLYAGLMIEKETQKPYVLEFNVRMGDPECQPIMMRMKSDLFNYINSAINGALDTLPPIDWDKNPAVCVVMAEKGYPSKYEKGNIINGLNSKFERNVMIFHAGTVRKTSDDNNNIILTAGGRVLGVTAMGKDFDNAIFNAYHAVNKISWGNNKQYYRKDIGLKKKTAHTSKNEIK